MKLIVLLASVFALPLLDSLIPKQYIVVFKDDTHQSAIDLHWTWLERVLEPLVPQPSLLSFSQDSRLEQYFESSFDVFGLIHKYELPFFKGYSARLPAFIVSILERHVDVDFIEQDSIMTISENTAAAPWGLTVSKPFNTSESPTETFQNQLERTLTQHQLALE